MKTSEHNLSCLKQANKPPSHVTGIWNAARQIVSLLTRVHIARSDFFLVFAAGKLGAFEPLLHCHVALLNPASTQLGAFRPGRPWAHPTAWELFRIRLFLQLLTPSALSGLPPAQLLQRWVAKAFADTTLFSLYSLWAGGTSKLRLHLDRSGSNHVAFSA